MPGSRKSATGKAPITKKRRSAKTSTTGTKKGGRLLVTCTPIMPHYLVEDVAESLHGAFFNDPDGHTLQVVTVRIDGQKVYGNCQEMYEAAPYMFLSL